MQLFSLDKSFPPSHYYLFLKPKYFLAGGYIILLLYILVFRLPHSSYLLLLLLLLLISETHSFILDTSWAAFSKDRNTYGKLYQRELQREIHESEKV